LHLETVEDTNAVEDESQASDLADDDIAPELDVEEEPTADERSPDNAP
jgi:hypothetical protein